MGKSKNHHPPPRGDGRRGKSPSVGACPFGGKAQYGTKKKAIRAMDRVNQDRKRVWGDSPIKNVYLCHRCGYWHFTSQEQE